MASKLPSVWPLEMKTAKQIEEMMDEIQALNQQNFAIFAKGIGVDPEAVIEAIPKATKYFFDILVNDLLRNDLVNGETEQVAKLVAVCSLIISTIAYLAGVIEGREIKASEAGP